jgi:TPR repeat protein
MPSSFGVGTRQEQKGYKTINRDQYKDKIRDLLTRAEAGDHREQFRLACVYQKGFVAYMDAAGNVRDTPRPGYTETRQRDYGAAAKWFGEAADQGHVVAMLKLATLCAEGCGVLKDYERAAGLLEKAAEQGSAKGLCRLGHCYRDNEGVDRDYTEAMRLYHRAAGLGYKKAKHAIGTMYENGWGVPLCLDTARGWQAEAAL